MRQIDADTLHGKAVRTKINEVFPDWTNLSANVKSAVIRYARAWRQLIEETPTVDQPRWIPATKLPPNDNEVLVWFEYFRYGSYQRLYRTIGIGRTFQGEWSGVVNGVSGWSSLKILAWMPLPEPPTPEECSAVGKEDGHEK